MIYLNPEGITGLVTLVNHLVQLLNMEYIKTNYADYLHISSERYTGVKY